MRLSYDEFVQIRRELKTLRDINRLPYPRGVLHCILQQKKVENVKRKYHIFAEKTEEIVDHWEKHRNFPRWLTLPPVMKVRLLLKGLGFSVRTINRSLSNPDDVQDEKLSELIKNAVLHDYVYSPLAAKLQQSRGKLGENAMKEELEKMGVDFKTERELRGVFRKTPDFYFEEPVEFNGRKIRWIESKALFGDPRTHEIYERKQYSRYREMFGEGVVVYWMGCLDSIQAIDEEVFRTPRKHSLLDMRVYLTDSKDEDTAESLGAVFVEVDDMKDVKAAYEIISAYSQGRVVAHCGSDEKRNIGRILRNMGFDVVHL
jgi:hypothetical protein